jgi:hypothetical protein
VINERTDPAMQISFAWWNTSLSPPNKPNRASKQQKDKALEIIEYLTQDKAIDCLALGEVTSDELIDVKKKLNLYEYELFDGTQKEGKLRFDTGVLFRKEVFCLINYKYIICTSGRNNSKAANRLDLMILHDKAILNLFVSHWPSRRYEGTQQIRNSLGQRLKEEIDNLNEECGGFVNAILMGDFNDEPFDRSLSEHLLTTRDREFVCKFPTFLYNPFWRHLGESIPYFRGKSNKSYAGSCYYTGGRDTYWRTFDQIIFSSAFLKEGDWQLNEKYTKIIDIEPYCGSVSSNKNIFDHFPVISVIERD